MCVCVCLCVCVSAMEEDDEIEQFAAAYVDYRAKWNGSMSDDHLTLSSMVSDAVICVVAAVLSVVTAGGNLLVVISYQTDRNLQTDLIFSRPRSEDRPHHGRTFSIYPCPLSF